MTKNKTEGRIEQDAKNQIITRSSVKQVVPLPTAAPAVSNNIQTNNLKAPSYAIQNEYAKAVIRVFATSVSIASALYPLEVIQMRKQMGVKGIGVKAGFFTPAMFNYKTIKPLVQGFLTANKSSLIKNSVIANRETVSTHVDSVVGEKGKESNKNVSNFKVETISAGLIAGIDTGFTQIYANLRSLNALGYTLSIPMSQKFEFFKQGLLIRGTRNYFSALACMGSTGMISDFLNPYISRTTNPVSHNALTSIIGGFAVAPFINTADVLYRRKIKGMNLETFETPSVKQIFTELVKPQGKFSFRGVKALGAGTFIGGVNGAVALAVLNGSSWVLDKYVFSGILPAKIVNCTWEAYNYFNGPSAQPKVGELPPTVPRTSQSRNGFFSFAASSSTAPKVEVVKEVEQPQTTGPKA
ncbi:hypothetical protein ACQUW5_03305 [Legionella sp. CNM-1927-20]|uniref:hypothetical protein n=1 Tax=Legionella sp. CNM-1927-20 TaxID=3422221 RepID=UPI00403B30E4